jgi:hypothetical protein
MHWVEDGTPLPTPDSAATGDLEPVGAYEGACYETEGWYRPVWSCLMRDLDSDFCPVCAEALVLSFYGYVEPIDEYGPPHETTAIEPSQTLELWVEAVAPEPDTISYSWTVDGEPQPDATEDNLFLHGTELGLGDHEVAVVVRDETPLVRSDPDGLTSQARLWKISVAGEPTDSGVVHASSSGCGCGPTTARRSGCPGLVAALASLLFV